MLETPHVVVAAALASRVANPALAIPLAFGSHFVLEAVPHWNPHLNTELKKYGKISENSKKIVIIDAFTSLIIGIAIASSALPDLNHAATILAACFFGVLPDLIEAPYYFFSKNNPLRKITEKADLFMEKTWIPFQKSLQVDTSALLGLTTQLVTVIVALLWIRG